MKDQHKGEGPEPEQRFPDQGYRINWRHILLILLFSWLIASIFFRSFGPEQGKEISYTEFKSQIRNGNVSEITMKGHDVTGKFKEPVKGEPGDGLLDRGPRDFQRFNTAIPPVQDPEIMAMLEKNNVVVRVETEEQSWFWTILISLLPWVLIIVFFVYMSRRFQERLGGAQGGPFGFGKSKAKLYTKSTSNVTFNDVAGLDNTKRELQEIVAFLKDPSKFQSLGGELPRGIMLVGPPGVGKTLMARAVAGEADVPFFSISGSEFIEMFVGVGASRVRDMFKNAKKEAPSIIFIDELDSIGRVRGTGLGGGHDEREQTLNQILSEMDGFSRHQSVVVMAATNRPDVLDPALVRPGRFDRRVTLDLPQKEAREKILKLHTRDVPLDKDVDLGLIAKRTVGFSGADIKNLVNEAALLAARDEKTRVGEEDFEKARDKLIMGIEREDVIKDEEKKIIAYHEAGHALVAALYPDADPLAKVSIIPRGRALGATEQIPEEDRYNLSRRYLLGRLAVILGGRAAEDIRFGDITTGAGDDLKKATELARRMVCQWGMSDRVGPVAFRRGDPHPFLGRELSEQRDFSEKTAQLIDEEVRRIIQDAETKAGDIIKSNYARLNALAEGLLEHETLDRDHVDRILESTGPEEEKAGARKAVHV